MSSDKTHNELYGQPETSTTSARMTPEGQYVAGEVQPDWWRRTKPKTPSIAEQRLKQMVRYVFRKRK